MAKMAALHPLHDPKTRPPKFPKQPKLQVCFSFAAYAKSLIARLHSLHIPILPGLSDPEFAALESAFRFRFPPDLRSILQEGLPAGPSFPNWHASSPQQLRILFNLPLLFLSKNVFLHNFWSYSWGPKPDDPNDALNLAKKLYRAAPVLVPVYRNCYVPSTPNVAGNPVFYIDGEDVRVLSFDVVRFFQEVDFERVGFDKPILMEEEVELPVWAATAARRIDFWTEAAERGTRTAARVDTRGWWWGVGEHLGLGACLEEVFWRLRDGGWRDEEVREMLMMMDGSDDSAEKPEAQSVGHARVLGLLLLRAGWSSEDVVDSLDLEEVDEMDGHNLG